MKIDTLIEVILVLTKQFCTLSFIRSFNDTGFDTTLKVLLKGKLSFIMEIFVIIKGCALRIPI